MTSKKPLTLYERACKGEFNHVLEEMYKKKTLLPAQIQKNIKNLSLVLNYGVEYVTLNTYRNTVTK